MIPTLLLSTEIQLRLHIMLNLWGFANWKTIFIRKYNKVELKGTDATTLLTSASVIHWQTPIKKYLYLDTEKLVY